MMEMWRDLPGYEGLYQVSNTGIVKSYDRVVTCRSGATRIHKGKELKQFQNERGYLCVTITKDKKSKIMKVHRLVALAYIDNPLNKPQINHIDCNKQNNNVSNFRMGYKFRKYATRVCEWAQIIGGKYMFNLRDFIKKGLLSAIGRMADYQVILNAVGWYEKGVLIEEDLAEIQAVIDAKNNLNIEVEELNLS